MAYTSKFWTEEKLQLLKDNYHRGTVYLVELFEHRFAPGTIKNVACENGISAPYGSGDRQYFRDVGFNFRYFDQDPTSNMFFILGYTFADGNITNNRLRFRCSVRDEDILGGIKNELGIQRELRYDEKKQRSGYVSKFVYLDVTHTICTATLQERWGILANKGNLDCDFPLDYVDLYPGHYVRGFNAGDGSNGCSQGICFVGTFNYIDQLAEYLSEKLEISRPGVGVSGNSYQVNWYSAEERMVLYKFMFPEGNYLHSKRKKLEIEIGLRMYPEGIKRFRLYFTESRRDLRRCMREHGVIVERVDPDYKYIVYCTFSDECNAEFEKFPNVKEVKKL